MSPRPRTALGAVALVAALLAASACGGSSSSSSAGGGSGDTIAPSDLPACPVDALDSAAGPVAITLWHPFVAKTADTLNAMVADFNGSQTKVKVSAEAQGSYDELAAKYRAAVPSKDLPAVAIFEDVNTRAVADSGTILPAQSCINADNYDMSDFLPSVTAFYSVKGALYPATANISSPLIYVNRNHLRRAGLDPDHTPATLAEVRDMAQKLHDAGIVDKPLALSLQPWFIDSWLNGEGEPLVDNDNGRGSGDTTAAVFDADPARQIYTWIRDMYRDGLLTPVPDTANNIDDYLGLANQNASMIIESSVAATSIKAFLKGDLDPSTLQGGSNAGSPDLTALDIGAGPFPGVSEPGKVQVGGSAWYLTNTGSPEVQAASWAFMKWWNEPAQQVRWNLEGSYLPYRVSAAADAKVVDNWTNDLSGRWLKISYTQLTEGADPAFPGAQFGAFDRYVDATRAATQDMIYKGTEPDAAVADAATATTDAITEYNNTTF